MWTVMNSGFIVYGHFVPYLLGSTNFFRISINEQREEQYQKVIEKNQDVITKQAEAFGDLSKDVSEIKQKILGSGDVQ
ncbi:hypothetical protein ACUOA5_48805, partial [Escherichia coli]